jgi:hypothetical protein
MPEPALVGGPGVEAPWWLSHGALLLGLGYGRGNGDGHRVGDLVLYRENVSKIAVVTLGPEMIAGLGFD